MAMSETDVATHMELRRIFLTTPELVNRADVDLVVIRCGTSRRYRQWYNRGRRIRERC
jgi:hypothetical protein